jgi:hypothetical protein
MLVPENCARRPGIEGVFSRISQAARKSSGVSLDQFVEAEGAIFLESILRMALGEARVYDAFVPPEGRIVFHSTGAK